MAVTIKHAKTDTIADWTQTDLDAQIALGNFPPGTKLADIVLPSDWNNDHTISGLGTMATQNANNVNITGGTISGATVSGYIPTTEKGVANGVATLDAGGQVPLSQLPPLGDLNYQGTWNASTNTPTLTSSVGTKGYYYVVSVAGSTNLNGITDWQIGDWAVYSGSAWQKVDNTQAYPAAGIANSTGSSWGTSYSVTGSGTVVALQTNPTLYNPNIDVIDFDTTYATTLTAGQLGWDGNNTLGLGMSGGNVIQEIGLQTYIYGKASSAITKGQLIKKSGVNGTSGVITFAPTTANMTNSDDIIGIAAESIALNAFGYVISTGNLRGFNTTGSSSGETWADGDALYYNPSGSGLMTNVKPSAPNLKVQIGVITNASSGGSGSVVVEINHGSTLGGTDSNVQITSPTNGQILTYDTSNTYWKNTSLTAGTGISISAATGGVLTVTNSSPDQTVAISGTSPVSVTGTYPNFTVSMTQANTSTNGWLSSTDWNTFNGKQTAYTNLSTIGALANGTGWLYNNGSGTFSYSTPTAADVGAVPTSRTISTTAPLAGGGALSSNLTLSMPAASGSQDGYLTSTDWTTFNSKGSGTVTSVSIVSANGLAGTVATATTTPAITLSTTVTGLLKGNGTAISAATSGTDYAPATSGSSILYGNGSGGFSNVTVGTGLSFSAGTLSATSSGGTVTSVSALTLGTTGTDLSSTVANSTTTPVITLNVPTASATNRGALSSTDWTTFNNKAPSVTYTSTYVPYGQGTTTPALSANFTYNNTSGDLTAPQVVASNGIMVSSKTVANSYSIASGSNAMSIGPVTVATGKSVTVPSGSRWVVL